MKKMLGGIKKHGLGGAVNKQLGQWAEPIAVQAEKIEGGVEKHGGLGEAMVAQVHAWTAPSSSDESALRREAEELEARRAVEEVARREAEELAARRAVEEVARREAEELAARRAVEEVARREAEELEARRAVEEVARREAEELVARKEAEELVARKEAEKLASRREAEELSAKKQAEKPTLKKFMLDFLRKSEDIEDDVAFSTIAKLHESQEDNATLAQMLFSLKDPVINKEVISWFVPAMGEGAVGDDVADDF
ncbi:hypothetical protein Megvenef_00263 [Candidatus Megaera venefica]|uniref:Uncharacterized protein n=1 Tax=Candidatus Megaera venefica TaxID=2055910 RepID=A0ABU5NAT1_9RICK|nr:hypothetical protein [Candidatus Megaera venefica]MEA0970305.1 hypothetical protein [Candidatus Megaera venefica]